MKKLLLLALLFIMIFASSCNTAKRVETTEQRIRLSWILIKFDRSNGTTTNAAAKNKLSNLRKRASEGYSFSRMAHDHSEDSKTKLRGGDIGWYRPIDLLPRNVKAEVWKLRVNEVSPILVVKEGMAIYTVTERQRIKK